MAEQTCFTLGAWKHVVPVSTTAAMNGKPLEVESRGEEHVSGGSPDSSHRRTPAGRHRRPVRRGRRRSAPAGGALALWRFAVPVGGS
jgi:hypothetical protein